MSLPHVELFNPQLPDSLRLVHISATVARAFDPACKCYLLSLLNTGQVQLPKEPHRLLSVAMPFLVLQVYIPTGKAFTLEVAFSDLSNARRRIVFANTKEVVRSQMHVRVPNYRLRREVWLNLCFDLATAAKVFFPGCVFKCIDQVRIGAVCRLRRIFCMRSRILDTTGDPAAEAKQYTYDVVPSTLDFPKTIRAVNQFVDCADCRLPDEKLFYTEPRANRKGKGDFLPELGNSLFVRKHQSLNVRTSRKHVDASEEVNFATALDSPKRLESLPASFKQSLQPRSIFQPHRDLSPEFFRQQNPTEVRHFTPPFVNVAGSDLSVPLVRYDPVLKAYDGL